jgi:ABC-type phosphate transport system substrate-binding protein
VGIGGLLTDLAELLLSGEASLILGIAAALGIGAPLAQRLVAGRKLVYYRVQSDSKIGLDVDLHDDDDADRHTDQQLIPVAKLLGRLSFVVIRIRNTNGDVSFRELGEDVEFTFHGRLIWNARISDARNDEVRDAVVSSLEFFSTDTESRTPAETTSLPRVRRWLPERMREIIRVPQATEPEPAPEPPPPVWHGIRLKRSLSLAPKEKFKLVVVLCEPETNRTGTLSKGVDGPSGRKRIKNEREVRRARWPWAATAVGALLAGVLVTVNVLPDTAVANNSDVECAAGELEIVGSSAFTPLMSRIAGEYAASCTDAAITVTSTGSIDGVRQVAAVEPAERGSIAALSDGEVGEATPELRAEPVAVIVYTLVVHDSVGLDRLTTEQVRDIYAGRYRDWNELRAGPSLPIRIISRGQESGSRRTFEQTVLDGRSEGALTSDSCESPRGSGDPIIRCERGSEQELVDEVSATPGAVGYVDLPSANEANAAGRPVTVVQLGEQYPDVSSIPSGYPFWTIEYLYTKGTPPAGSVSDSFVEYLRSSVARAELQDVGYTPCIGKDGQLYLLCRG